MKTCKIKNCQNPIKSRELCNKHYLQITRHNKILERTRFDENEIIEKGEYAEILLYDKNNKEKARGKIDISNIDKIINSKWCMNTSGYITRNNGKEKYIHRVIINETNGKIIDHINHDKLDNRRKNLRLCSHSQNSRNRESKGITWDKENNKWMAQIVVNYKNIKLGRYLTKEEALTVRHKAEKKYFKEFAYNRN